MNVHTSKKSLLAALDLLCKVIPTRSTNPLITALLVRSSASGLTLSGTSLDVDVRVHVPCEVALGAADAAFTVPAHLWHQMVSTTGGALISLDLSGTQLHMSAAGSELHLSTGSASEYPELSFPAPDGATILPAADLRAALDAVLYASSKEAFQAVFRGVRFEFTPQHVRTVASDGYRLAWHDLPGVSGPSQYGIIPARSVPLLLPVLRGADAVSVTVQGGQLSVSAGGVSMNVKLLDGDYPDYRRVIPVDSTRTVTVSAAALSEALTRVSVLTDRDASYRVDLLVHGAALKLQSESEYGRATDTLSVTQTGAQCEEPLSVAFNSRYLQDALRGALGEVQLSLGHPTSPALLTCSGVDGYHAVVVPLRAS